MNAIRTSNGNYECWNTLHEVNAKISSESREVCMHFHMREFVLLWMRVRGYICLSGIEFIWTPSL